MNHLNLEQQMDCWQRRDLDTLTLSVLPFAYSIARRIARHYEYDADDAIGLAQLAVVRSIRYFDPRIAMLTSYMHKCVNTFLVDSINRERRLSTVTIAEGSEFVGRDSTFLEAADRNERERIRLEVDRLPPRLREVIQLHVFDGRSFEDLTSHFGCSRQRIHQLYSKAVSKLRARLEP